MTFPAQAKEGFFVPDLKTAERHYKNEEYDKAYEHWNALMHHHESDAYLGMGKLFMRGLGVEKDENKALALFMKSAEQNNKKAQYEIGHAYEKGRGVTTNLTKAKEWYRLSAANNYKRSEDRLKELDINYLPDKKALKTPVNHKIKTNLKSQFVVEENLSLGQDQDTQTGLVNEAQVTASYTPIKDIRLFTKMRGVNSNGNIQSNDDDDDQTMNANFIEVKEAWIDVENIGNIAPLSLKIGRQRFREDQGIWWDRDLDAVRLSYDTTLAAAFIGMGQNLSRYRLGSDNELEQDEQNRLRLLGGASYDVHPNHKISGRFLYEYDHSDLENIGQIIDADDRDNEDNNLLWLGTRLSGSPTLPNNSPLKFLHYRTDLMGVMGKTENITTISGPSPDTRRVNAHQKKNVLGFAFDGHVEAQIDAPLDPTISFGYAYASGDDGQGSDSAFRQTGLDGNTHYFPNSKIRSPLRNYGEVLRPELSNLHVLKLGTNIPVLESSDLNFHYFSYWRDDENTGLRSNGLDIQPTNNGHHIGHALDATANFDMNDLFPLKNKFYDDLYFKIKMGAFKAGDAYGTAKNEMAYKGTAEVNLKF